MNGADKGGVEKPEEKPKKAAASKKAPAAEKKVTEKKEKAPAKKRAPKKVSSHFFRIHSLCLTYFTGCRRVQRRLR